MKDSMAAVIPAFNEGSTIADLIEQTLPLVDWVIVVDDGSIDDTANIAERAGAKVLRHTRNSGKAAALATGFGAALKTSASVVVTLDGDGQHRPQDILSLKRAGDGDNNFVIGVRSLQRENVPWLRGLANRCADRWISIAAGQRIEDSQSGFRLYPRKLLEELDLAGARELGFAIESEILIEACWRGYQICTVAIPAIYNDSLRASHYRSIKDTLVIVSAVARRVVQRLLGRAGSDRHR